MFRFGSEEFGATPLCEATSAEGLFVDVEDPGPAEIAFTGLVNVVSGLSSWTKPRELNFLEVDVLSTSGRMLGTYGLGTARVRFDGEGAAGPAVILDGAEPVPLPGGLSLWRRWCDESKPLVAGEWLLLPVALRDSWLQIAGSVWGVSGYAEPSGGSSEPIRVDGRLVVDETSLYLALGEAIAGPGGYVGWGLDALDDCLSNLSSRRLELVWDHFASSRESLGAGYLSEVLELLDKRKVSVVGDA